MMDRKQIEQWARECALDTDELALHQLTRFAALVAAYEREQCALVCDGLSDVDNTTPENAAWAIRNYRELSRL